MHFKAYATRTQTYTHVFQWQKETEKSTQIVTSSRIVKWN